MENRLYKDKIIISDKWYKNNFTFLMYTMHNVKITSWGKERKTLSNIGEKIPTIIYPMDNLAESL